MTHKMQNTMGQKDPEVVSFPSRIIAVIFHYAKIL